MYRASNRGHSYPDSFANDPCGAYTVIFHECGHAIDDLGDVQNVIEALKYEYFPEASKVMNEYAKALGE